MRVQKWLLILAAAFAMGWSIIRACVQSVTLDEADTYFWFVAQSQIFYPFPNKHVLNTLLIWIATHLFGLSTLTLRLPALLGAALYISACWWLCRNLTDRFGLQFPLFICLVYNPLILDFMLAARGYSLADAFLLTAIAIPVWYHSNGRASLGRCCGLALGLSFAANFSFGFVDLAAFLALLTWAARQKRETDESASRIFGLCVFPGLLVTLVICGYPLTHWKRGYLFYGATSLSEMMRSLVEGTLYHMNPRFGGSLFKAMRVLHPKLLPALGLLCACQLVAISVDGSWRRARWLRNFASWLAGITALALVMHWLAFRLVNLPLPMSRTGIFLLPLCTLLAGAIVAVPTQSLVSRWLRRSIVGVFLCLGFYFVLCLRLNYFKEYEYGRDIKDVYSVLARLNHSYGVSDVAASGLYASSLNFYRTVSKRETFLEFVPVPGKFPPGRSIYVMNGTYDRAFIKKEGLAVAYRCKSTDVVVAIRPGRRIPSATIEP